MPGNALQLSHQLFSRETIQRLEKKQSKFKKLVATSKDYSKIEKSVVNLDTVAEFDAFWQKTNDAKVEFDQNHERGCGLFSKRYQSSAVVVRSFMKDFSPIIEIVQDFAAPYGRLAVGTISVLFAVGLSFPKIRHCKLTLTPGRR